MPSLSIKDVPESIAQKLRARAARNHRSLQGELMALISAAVEEPATARTAMADAGPATPEPMHPRTVPRTGSRSIEEIAAEHRRRWPEPIAVGTSAAQILRTERDRR